MKNTCLLLAFLILLFAAKSYAQCVTAYSTDNINNICSGDTVYLSSSYDSTCFLPVCTQVTDSLSTVHQLQSGTPFNAKSIYGNFYKGYRYQFLYTAAELQAVFDTGYIEQLAWRIETFNSNSVLQNFALSIKNVSADSAMLNDWNTAMTLVYGPQNYTPAVTSSTRWNAHNLAAPFYWDGVSSLVIEVRYYNPNTSNNMMNMMTVTNETGKVLYAMANSDVYANQTAPTAWTERPVLRIKMCETSVVPVQDTAYWTTDGPDTVQYNAGGNAFAKVSAPQSYKAYIAKKGILKNSASLDVTTLARPSVASGSATICKGLTATVYTQIPYDSYFWNTGDTSATISVSDSGWYWVTATKGGCVMESVDSVYVSVAPPINASVAISAGSNPSDNNLVISPPTASGYWLQRAYDTLSSNVFTATLPMPQATLTCYNDSAIAANGNYIRVIVQDANGCNDTTNWERLTNCLTGITEHNGSLSFSVYPNPVDDVAIVTLNGPAVEELQLSLTDMQGRLIAKENFPAGMNTTNWKLSTAQLQNGIYTLHMRSGNRSGQVLLVK